MWLFLWWDNNLESWLLCEAVRTIFWIYTMWTPLDSLMCVLLLHCSVCFLWLHCSVCFLWLHCSVCFLWLHYSVCFLWLDCSVCLFSMVTLFSLFSVFLNPRSWYNSQRHLLDSVLPGATPAVPAESAGRGWRHSWRQRLGRNWMVKLPTYVTVAYAWSFVLHCMHWWKYEKFSVAPWGFVCINFCWSCKARCASPCCEIMWNRNDCYYYYYYYTLTTNRSDLPKLEYCTWRR